MKKSLKRGTESIAVKKALWKMALALPTIEAIESGPVGVFKECYGGVFGGGEEKAFCPWGLLVLCSRPARYPTITGNYPL